MAGDAAYRKAKEKIEKALHTRAIKLNLSGMGLPKLPELLGQLTQLAMKGVGQPHAHGTHRSTPMFRRKGPGSRAWIPRRSAPAKSRRL